MINTEVNDGLKSPASCAGILGNTPLRRDPTLFPASQLLRWWLVIDRRFHRRIYLFGCDKHGRFRAGRPC